MADTKLLLGDFEFKEFEIPEKIPLGGSQALVIHKLPGGARIIQPMGRDDDPIQWTGLFRGDTALDRVRQLDSMRVQGKPLTLSFFHFSLSVVIRAFRYSVEKFYRIPYTLELEVVEDLTRTESDSIPTGIDASVRADSSTAVALGGKIGDSTLTSALATMDGAIKQVSDVAKATQATINSVLAPVSAVMSRVNTLIGSVGSTITNVTTLGGILPNNPVAQNAAKLLNQVNSATQLPFLYNLRSVAGRIQTNLNLVSTAKGASTVTVGGGNLFNVASKAYGDATKWVSIAQANKINDPIVTSIQTIKIPDNPPDNGGVYTA